MNKLIIIIILILLSTTIYSNNEFSISGNVYFQQQKPIYILLVDEITSKTPFLGIKTLIIYPNSNDIKNGFIFYKFNKIPKGKYGIRCFQDINENKKLDKGFFGPSEPWGLSWNKNNTSKFPSFDNFCFTLTTDIEDIDIILKQ